MLDTMSLIINSSPQITNVNKTNGATMTSTTEKWVPSTVVEDNGKVRMVRDIYETVTYQQDGFSKVYTSARTIDFLI
jgi:hypothetical protein|tara:strand:+ start:701 stop:931 length:231 start_codon:yes stop_codon:yes gene_type:complete